MGRIPKSGRTLHTAMLLKLLCCKSSWLLLFNKFISAFYSNISRRIQEKLYKQKGYTMISDVVLDDLCKVTNFQS